MTNENEAKISVIIPLYNVEQYVEKSLSSIKNQTFKAYELIIIDDCSTDNSKFYVHRFISENPQIKCLFMHNDHNKGDTYSRNRGMKESKGEYICFMDPDDIWHPEFLNLLYHEIVSQNADLVFCGYDRCYETRVMPYTETWKYPHNESIFNLKLNYLTGKTQICHCTILYRHSFLLKTGLSYTEGCRTAGDTEFVTKVLFNNPRFSYVPQSLYYYNIHPNSISTRYPSSMKYDGYFAYERAKKYIKNPLWKIFFLLTKEARKVASLIEEFYDHNVKLPYLFCSRQKVIVLLFVVMITKRTKKSRKLLSFFYHTYY